MPKKGKRTRDEESSASDFSSNEEKSSKKKTQAKASKGKGKASALSPLALGMSIDCWLKMLEFLGSNDEKQIFHLMMVNHDTETLFKDERLWRLACLSRLPMGLEKDSVVPALTSKDRTNRLQELETDLRTAFMKRAKTTWKDVWTVLVQKCCACCGKKTSAKNPAYDGKKICLKCSKHEQSPFQQLTKTAAKKKFKLSDAILEELPCQQKTNFHHPDAAPIKLYLKSDLEAAKAKLDREAGSSADGKQKTRRRSAGTKPKRRRKSAADDEDEEEGNEEAEDEAAEAAPGAAASAAGQPAKKKRKVMKKQESDDEDMSDG